jgi:hypothetical protein
MKEENEKKDIVQQIEAIAKEENKSGLVVAAMKGKPNITALIIEVKLEDGTLKREDLDNAINTKPPAETLDTLKVGIAQLEAKQENKPLLVYLAETNQPEIMQLALNQKEKYDNLNLPGVTRALEIAKENHNDALVEILTSAQKKLSIQQCESIKSEHGSQSSQSSRYSQTSAKSPKKQKASGIGM